MKHKISIKLYSFAKAVATVLVKTTFKYEVKGLENIPKEKSFILAGNHIHAFDPVLLGLTCDKPINFVAKKEIFKNKIASWFLTKLGAIAVDRQNPGISVIRDSVKVLKHDGVLGIFPEGTRSKTGEMLPFKAGIDKISSLANSPIIPFSITGSYNLKNGVTLEYGSSIDFKELDIPKGEHTEYLEGQVKKLVMKNR